MNKLLWSRPLSLQRGNVNSRSFDVYDFTRQYSPELNPDEYLNQVLKQSVHSGILPKTKDDIKKTRDFMQYMKRYPEKVKKLFEHRNLEYIASEGAFSI